jgi:hypothetical protein
MSLKEYLNEGNSQIDFSKVRLNNLEDLFKAVDFTFKGETMLYYYKNIAEFAEDMSDVYGVTDLLEIAISSFAHSPKITTEPLIFSKRSKKIYGIYSGKVDGNRLKKLSSDLDVEINNETLARDFLK